MYVCMYGHVFSARAVLVCEMSCEGCFSVEKEENEREVLPWYLLFTVYTAFLF